MNRLTGLTFIEAMLFCQFAKRCATTLRRLSIDAAAAKKHTT